ncbi:hypothetical protein ACFL0I_02690 [Gemmatimonadota bacterium]
MLRTFRFLLVLVVLALSSGCTARPVILHSGSPPGEFAVIEVVSQPDIFSLPSIQMHSITNSSGRKVWDRESWDQPWKHYFELPPGTYQIKYNYSSVSSGNRNYYSPGTHTTTLNCKAGRRYILEGSFMGVDSGWVLTTMEVAAGGGG